MADRPAIVLVPGLLCDETVWAAQRAALERVGDVLTPVLWGLDSIPAMARAVLDAAPARFALAGHSLGARVALEAVRQAPERVERLALLDTGTHPVRPGEQLVPEAHPQHRQAERRRLEEQARSALTGPSNGSLVEDIAINWVWMPPWGPEKITEDGREQLRALGFRV